MERRNGPLGLRDNDDDDDDDVSCISHWTVIQPELLMCSDQKISSFHMGTSKPL